MCIFCDSQNIGELLLQESAFGFVICNKIPITTLGHFLVVPNEHYSCLSEISIVVQQDIFSLMNSFLEKMKDGIRHDGLNVHFNEGEFAGQSIEHFHIHLIFREKNDGISNMEKKKGNREIIEARKISHFRRMLK